LLAVAISEELSGQVDQSLHGLTTSRLDPSAFDAYFIFDDRIAVTAVSTSGRSVQKARRAFRLAAE
jgi:hypothetical protein